MSDAKHALLGASSAHCWAYCAAALREQRDIPNRRSRDADEGTAVHDLSAWALTENKHPSEYPETHINVDGTSWKITKEMIDSAWTYVQSVRKEAEGGTLLVEQRVTYGPSIFGSDTMTFSTGEGGTIEVDPKDIAWGTSDTVILQPEEIRIKDFKNGANPNNIVMAEDNEQLLLYLTGALYEYEMVSDFKRGHVSISQPRLNHAPEHSVSIEELREFGKRMGEAGRRALEVYYRAEEPDLILDYAPSDSACKWCRAKATCPAFAADVRSETRDLFAGIAAGADLTKVEVTMNHDVPEDRLAQAMRMAPILEMYVKAIRAEVERRLIDGQPVAGFKLVEGRRGARAWTSAEDAEAQLRAMRLKHDEIFDYKLASPTSIEKVLKTANPRKWSKLQALIGQSDGKPSVAPESDKRPAISVGDVEKKFALLADLSESEDA